MGETACFVNAFPCDSGAPTEAIRGNPLDALGDSIAFGRFVNESLTWDDKWSAFPQKRYVEEAEKYSQPGSVAQKKAFFEAHYKRIAAMKAAALLEEPQQQQGEICNNKIPDLQTIMLTSPVGFDEHKEVGCVSNVKPVDTERPMNDESVNRLNNSENQTEISSISQIEKPLLNKPVVSCLNSLLCDDVTMDSCLPTTPKAPPYPMKENIATTIVKVCPTESTDKNRSSPKSLRKLFSSSPVRDPNEVNIPVAQAVEISTVAPNSSSKTTKPTKAYASEVQKNPSTIVLSETGRTKTPSASGSKRARSKWHILVALFSKSLRACRKRLCYSMLSSKKEESDSRRKQKVHEKKFNDNETLETELKTKFKQVETEVKKLRKSLFSSTQQLPEFYSEREKSKNKQIPQSSKL